MKTLPLRDIRLNRASHRSALWWAGLLYRSPMRVEAEGGDLGRWQQAALIGRLYLHCLPYFGLLGAFGRAIIWQVLEIPLSIEFADSKTLGVLALLLASFFIVGLAAGPFFGLLVGLAFGPALSLAIGLALSLAIGLAPALVFGLAESPAAAVAGLVMGLACGLVFGLLVALAGELVGGLFAGLASGAAIGIGISLFDGPDFPVGNVAAKGFFPGYFVMFLRLYYMPAHLLFFWPRVRPRVSLWRRWPGTVQGSAVYPWHPAAWDGACLLPFPALDRLLIAYTEQNPDSGEREIERLIDTYPSQRQAALRAKAILVTRRAGELVELARLDESLAGLPESDRGFLTDVPEVRRRVHEVASAQARLDTLQRPFLREPYAALVVKEIEAFRSQIAGFRPPLSTELRESAGNWLDVARRQLEETRRALSREPTRQVFRAGDPVYRDQEAFLYRDVLFHELERQMMLAAGCPGLLIYGRRRMGKTTLLNNLPGFMPSQLGIAYLSMDSAAAFSSLESFTQQVAHQSRAAFPSVLATLDVDTPQDLESLETFLARVDERLKRAERRLLLAIDEFENLNVKIGEGVIPVDLLAVVRASIQRHRQIVWAFAGSHSISELAHAPWTSYLVSARTVEIPPFALEETRLLLTEPLKHSTLWRDLDSSRPSFAAVFWGPEGIERIQAETGGWPHLVQLVAEAVVDLVNDAGVEVADAALLDRAFDKAVTRGDNVLMELAEKECRLPGEWEYLLGFRTKESQTVPRDEEIARSLRRRLLVTQDLDCFRLRVPLMGRWLRSRV